jgi:hypothetical protein
MASEMEEPMVSTDGFSLAATIILIFPMIYFAFAGSILDVGDLAVGALLPGVHGVVGTGDVALLVEGRCRR